MAALQANQNTVLPAGRKDISFRKRLGHWGGVGFESGGGIWGQIPWVSQHPPQVLPWGKHCVTLEGHKVEVLLKKQILKTKSGTLTTTCKVKNNDNPFGEEG